MIALISPSKDLNYTSDILFQSNDLPRLFDHSKKILEVISKKKRNALMKLMNISVKLADENLERYQSFSEDFNSTNSRQAIFAFAGDVYRGLDAFTLDAQSLKYSQEHVRILSGLYGLLRPFDLMQAYRLEMGIPLKVSRHKNLYSFWGSIITDLLQQDIEESKSKHLINLASKEYFEAIHLSKIKVPVINIHFREYKKNVLSFVSYTAKRARGLMIRQMAIDKMKIAEDLKNFNLEDYHFSSELSDDLNWFFIR